MVVNPAIGRDVGADHGTAVVDGVGKAVAAECAQVANAGRGVPEVSMRLAESSAERSKSKRNGDEEIFFHGGGFVRIRDQRSARRLKF